MKNKIVESAAVALVIFASASVHVLPVLALAMIAAGGDLTRAWGALLLLSSCLALGFIHGLNGTFCKRGDKTL
jgi:hypothetical protein